MNTSLMLLNKLDTPAQFHVYMCSFPLLTEQEEMSLLKNCKECDISSNDYKESVQKLVLYHLRCVTKIALKIYDCVQSFKDIVSEGIKGLLDAIQHFDFSKNVRFISYAKYWVQYRISEWLKNKSVVKNSTEILSLDKPINNDDESFKLEDVLGEEDTSIERFEEQDQENYFLKLLNESFSVITEREKQIVLDYNKGKSFQEIGDGIGISRERVRQLYDRSLKRMKEYMKSKNIVSLKDV